MSTVCFTPIGRLSRAARFDRYRTGATLGRMRTRDVQPEAMDAAEIDPSTHQTALRGLARLNRFSGVSRLMYRRLRSMARSSPRPLRVLDVATGSGDLPIDWLRRARRDGLVMHLTGVDISPHAVQTAAAAAATAGVTAEWLVADVLEAPFFGGFDVVTCSLFMHHLLDHDVMRLLQVMRAATDEDGSGEAHREAGVVPRLLVCDLVRSPLNLLLVSAAARLLSRSPVVHGDAALSVRAAMTRREFARLAEKALGKPVHVAPAFPCRYIAEVDLR